MKKLYILFDDQCGFCWECRGWMQQQSAFLELEFIGANSAKAHLRFPSLAKQRPDAVPVCSMNRDDELTVIDDEGGVYRGGDAFIICLYALEEYREWAEWLASPTLRPFARQGFELLSKNRGLINQWLDLGGKEYAASKLREAVQPHHGDRKHTEFAAKSS